MDFRITSIKTSNVTFDWALDMMEKQSVVITAKIVNDVLIEIRRFSVVTPGEQFVNNRETHFLLLILRNTESITNILTVCYGHSLY